MLNAFRYPSIRALLTRVQAADRAARWTLKQVQVDGSFRSGGSAKC